MYHQSKQLETFSTGAANRKCLRNYRAVTNCVTTKGEMKELPVELSQLIRILSEITCNGNVYFFKLEVQFPSPDEIRNKQLDHV